MCVSMSVYLCVSACVYVVWTSQCRCVDVCFICAFLCVYIGVFVCVCVCVCVYVFACFNLIAFML